MYQLITNNIIINYVVTKISLVFRRARY